MSEDLNHKRDVGPIAFFVTLFMLIATPITILVASKCSNQERDSERAIKELFNEVDQLPTAVSTKYSISEKRKALQDVQRYLQDNEINSMSNQDIRDRFLNPRPLRCQYSYIENSPKVVCICLYNDYVDDKFGFAFAPEEICKSLKEH